MKRTCFQWSTLLPVMIIISGFLLRAYPMITKDFWEDELFTYYLSNKPASYTEQIIHPIDDRPPLYYLYAKLLSNFGTSEIFLRLPGFICSILALQLLYFFFKRHHNLSAHSILFLMSFSIFLIELSWQFRDYGILTLITTFSIVYLYQIIFYINQNSIPPKHVFFYFGLSAVVGCMTNYLYIAYILSCYVGICIAIYLTDNQHKKDIFLRFGASLFPALSLSGVYLFNQTSSITQANNWIPNATMTSYYALIAVAFGCSTYFYEFPHRNFYMEQKYFYIILPIIASVITSFTIFWKKKNTPLYLFSLICFSIFLTNVLIVQIISRILQTSIFLPRTFTPAIITVLISAGSIAAIVVETIIHQQYKAIFIRMCALIYLCMFLNLYTDFFQVGTFTKPNPDKSVNQLLTFLDKSTKEGDQIVFFPAHYNYLYIPYFWRHRQYKSYLRFASFIQKTVENKSQIPVPSEIPEQSQIFFVSNNSIQDPQSEHYDKSYVSYNKTIFTLGTKYCTSHPTIAMSSPFFTVQSCRFTANN